MKRFGCLALLFVMLAASVCALAAGETVTSEGVGYTNVPYSGGYRGFCIDRQLTGAYEGDIFTVAQNTSVADNNVTHEDISQKLKVLFVHCFEDLFVSDSNGSYEIPSSMADSGLGLAVYHFAGEQPYVWGESKALVEKVNAYTGPAIPDHGYQKTLENGDTIEFDFAAFVPQKQGQQTFFAYRIEIAQEDVAETCMVQFNPNGGSGTMDDQEFTQDEAQKLTANKFSRTGHTFEGWNTRADGMGTAYADEQSVTVSGDMELYAQWKPETYEINYALDGGEITGSYPENYTYGEGATLPENVERDGYTFLGWYDEDGNKVERIDGDETGDKTFAAKWEENRYDVIVVPSENGDVTAKPDNGTENERITVSVTPDDGYELDELFVGGEKVDVNDDGTYTFLMPDEDVEIRATFKKIIYTVTVTDDGHGIGNATPGSGESGTEVTLTATPSEGYQFKEWQVISGGVTIDGNKLTIEDEDVVVKAIFEEIPPTVYTVHFDANGGSGTMEDQLFEAGVEQTLNHNTFFREGYTFAGWNTEADGSGTAVADGASIQITGNGTLYAQWTVNPPVNPLRIVQQPVDQTVIPGQTATFSVVAQGDGLTYQWYVDYNDGHGLQELEGADDPVYVTSVVQPGNDGYIYVCIVTDVYGNTVSSETAVLHVVTMPALPATGDSSNVMLYLAMGMLSMLGLALLRRKAGA